MTSRFARLLLILLVLPVAASAKSDGEALYPEAVDYPVIFEQMDAARERAIASDRLVLYVLGANWCHDSTNLLQKIDQPAVASVLDKYYEVNLINVGYLEYVREVVSRYRVPVIYGTPTVLVVEPRTNTLLNRDSLPYWRSAEMRSLDETVAYFKQWRPDSSLPAPDNVGPALAGALYQIDTFEIAQAERIYRAYAVLGEMMRELGEDKPDKDFYRLWENLAAMRSSITEDLEALRASAESQAAAGADYIELEFPSYSLFIDGD